MQNHKDFEILTPSTLLITFFTTCGPVTSDSSPDWDLVGWPRFVILRTTGLITDEFGKS